MSIQYPIVEIPDKIFIIKESVPPINLPTPHEPRKPELKIITKPREPSKPDAPFDGCGKYLLYFIALGGISLWIANNAKNSKAGADLAILGVFILAGVIFIIIGLLRGNQKDNTAYESAMRVYQTDIKNYPVKVKLAEETNKRELNNYESDLKEYHSAIEVYNCSLKDIRSQKKINIYRKRLLEEFLNNSTQPVVRNNSHLITKGVSEDYFSNELQRKLNYEISQDLMLKFPKSENGYFPDITIFDKDVNLFIDIEIDEPYIGGTGEPIHYIGCQDNKRDEYFSECRWVVIRLTEEQVIKHTQISIDFISFVISAILNVESITHLNSNELINSYPKLNKFSVTQWTKEEAHKKAFGRYRNLYLGITFSEQLFTETNTISSSIKKISHTHTKTIDEDLDDLPF